MNALIIRLARGVGKLIGKKNGGKLIVLIFKITDAPLMKLAYQQYGILKYESITWSGELGVVRNILVPLIERNESLIDIGANVGEYTLMLEKYFPGNPIYSVEPNKETFDVLESTVKGTCINTAISRIEGEISFYVSEEVAASTQASISIESIPDGQTPKEIKVKSTTLAKFIEDFKIPDIGLLKIDSEGHDLEVLSSGKDVLPKVKFIQFEFNEKYVYTRTFLKDFFALLHPTHHLFRLDTTCIRDINDYTPYLEVFRYQNILAVRKDVVLLIPKEFIKH